MYNITYIKKENLFEREDDAYILSFILENLEEIWSFQRKEFLRLFEHLQAYFIKFLNNFTSTSTS